MPASKTASSQVMRVRAYLIFTALSRSKGVLFQVIQAAACLIVVPSPSKTVPSRETAQMTTAAGCLISDASRLITAPFREIRPKMVVEYLTFGIAITDVVPEPSP